MLVETQLLETEHSVLEYSDTGGASAPVVLLVHGFPDTPATWDAVIDRLPSDVRTVTVTLRGVGRSRAVAGHESGEVAALAADVLALADALDLHDVILVGHDWGARATHAAAVLHQARFRGLVTLATAYGPRTDLTPTESLDDAEVAWYRYWLCTRAGADAFASDPHALLEWAWDHWSDPAVIDRRAREAMLPWFDNDQFVDTVIHYYRHGAGEAPGAAPYSSMQSELDRWPVIRVPTTFLVGTDDGCETLPAAQASRPFFGAGYTVQELDGVGHFVQREAPDAVAAAITVHL